MTLIRASLITGLATVARMICGLLLNKIFALYVGPAGLGQVAQLSSLAGIVNGLATAGVGTGVTRYVAEYGDVRRAAPLLSTALALVCLAACISSIALVAFSERLAERFLGSEGLAWVIWVLAAANLLTAFNALMVAVLNGRKRIALIAVLGIVGSLLSLLAGASLTLWYGLEGALIAACLAPALPAVALGIYLAARRRDESLWRPGKPDALSFALLARYSLMTLTAAIAGPTSVLLVRENIASQLSWDAAGHWQGVWRISDVYLTLVTSSLAVYFLPRLAELKETAEMRRELRQTLLTAVSVVAAAALLIYVLRDWITVTLYSQAFLPMTVLFPFQLLGDVVKIAGWLFAYLMLARAMTVAYIITEVAFAAAFFGLAAIFVGQYGLVGASYAHALNYMAYLMVVWYLTRRLFRADRQPR